MAIEDVTRDAVVVGVDGRSDTDAIIWAADEAALEGRRLVIAHADAPRACTDRRAEAITGLATSRHAALRIDHIAVSADPRHFLVEVSPGARLLVLGSRGRGGVGSRLLGSVGTTVLRHAACPVVIARRPDSRWKAGVLVGADGTAESRPVVEFAFQLASFRNLPLTVMHASFDPYLPDDTAREALASGAAASYGLLLAESVSGLSETYPDVHVMRRLGRGLVDEQLTRNLHPWDVVVVGRHQPRRRLGTVGATVATSVLERFRGVVAVVPEATEVRATDDETW